MRDEERLARDLYERLGARARGDVGINGESVDVRSESRRAVARCFWSGGAAGLMLGMNPANARASRGVRRKPYRPEYLIVLYAGAQRCASSRSRDVEDVVSVMCAWIADRPIAGLEASWPFVNESLRRIQRVHAAVEASCGDTVRMYIGADMDELSIEGDGRSCRVLADDEGVGCTFLLRAVQVAFGDITSDPGTAITAWMRGATLAELATLGIAIERHAELWEREEYLRWHWMHVRDRIADPDDELAPLRPLLEKLADSSIATQFYSFSSLYRFYFSACSHYPWVTEGLPMIAGIDDKQRYVIEIDHRPNACSIDEAVALIERVLAAYPIRPFRGSKDDRETT